MTEPISDERLHELTDRATYIACHRWVVGQRAGAAWEELVARLRKAEAERDTLRNALEFYASPGSWRDPGPYREPFNVPAILDCGERARAALKETGRDS